MPDELRRDRLEVYKAILQDTSQLRDGRDVATSVYVTLLTSVLAAEAFVAVNSELDSWVSLFACIFVSLSGLQVTALAGRVSEDLRHSLSFRLKWLENAERSPDLGDIGANFFLEEYYDRHPESRPEDMSSASHDVQGSNSPSSPPIRRVSALPSTTRNVGITWDLFRLGFMAIPILLAIVAALASILLMQPYIQPLCQQGKVLAPTTFIERV